MFSIYCISIFSLSSDECQVMFGFSKEDLLMRYQLGCKQALLNCSFLRSSDSECLTALYLYLVSFKQILTACSLLTAADIGQIQPRSAVTVLHAWYCNADCPANGHI